MGWTYTQRCSEVTKRECRDRDLKGTTKITVPPCDSAWQLSVLKRVTFWEFWSPERTHPAKIKAHIAAPRFHVRNKRGTWHLHAFSCPAPKPLALRQAHRYAPGAPQCRGPFRARSAARTGGPAAGGPEAGAVPRGRAGRGRAATHLFHFDLFVVDFFEVEDGGGFNHFSGGGSGHPSSFTWGRRGQGRPGAALGGPGRL